MRLPDARVMAVVRLSSSYWRVYDSPDPATVVEADIVRRLPATAVRIAHPAAAALRPMAAEGVDITAAEVEVVADITAAAEAAVRAPAAEVVVIRAVAAATPEVIAESS